jgi:hypothetical protein
VRLRDISKKYDDRCDSRLGYSHQDITFSNVQRHGNGIWLQLKGQLAIEVTNLLERLIERMSGFRADAMHAPSFLSPLPEGSVLPLQARGRSTWTWWHLRTSLNASEEALPLWRGHSRHPESTIAQVVVLGAPRAHHMWATEFTSPLCHLTFCRSTHRLVGYMIDDYLAELVPICATRSVPDGAMYDPR